MILGGDIGGTKVLLGLMEAGRPVIERRYASADFSGFEAVLARFLREAACDPRQITATCLALAGPLADDGRTARLTHLPWHIDSEALARRFGLPPIRLVNDFAAAALAAVMAPAAQRSTLQPGIPLAAAPCLVVGAGTGLGMAIALPEGQRWRIIPGEGGHAAFAPADDEQLALWRHLTARHGRVGWEMVVSGPGLAAIHEFIAGESLPPEEISARALASADGAARRALELFLAAYGAFAGDMALACLARGGVFLAGGIAGKLLPALHDGPFLEAFNAKAEHAALAARMPIHVISDPALGLHGAFSLAGTQSPLDP
ncbi:MAG: glucokinase [Betaproteobacteria bacterium HGW-Betaproteobacteria-11]|nr:MAG: glucokinase [Betaproteobacteria bacterium HGW-Betaproteobacteria-11]